MMKKDEIFQQAANLLFAENFRLIDADITRPWGFFLSIDEGQAQEFIDKFYKSDPIKLGSGLPLRPKILGVAPGQKLSWQYHHRRSEIWRCISGEFGFVSSPEDDQPGQKLIKTGDVVNIDVGVRHRAIGLERWALIAEVWVHQDPKNPSDEQDIIRLDDDFGRI